MRPEAAQHPLFVDALLVELARELLDDIATSRLQRVVWEAHVAQKQIAPARRYQEPLTAAAKADSAKERTARTLQSLAASRSSKGSAGVGG